MVSNQACTTYVYSRAKECPYLDAGHTQSATVLPGRHCITVKLFVGQTAQLNAVYSSLDLLRKMSVHNTGAPERAIA